MQYLSKKIPISILILFSISITALSQQNTAIVTIPPETSSSTFSDVTTTLPYYTAINTLKNDKIINGYQDNTFKPDNSINRAEFIKIVLKSIEQEASGKNCFRDVTDQWFAPYICKASELNLVNGYSDGNFKPENLINFAEASKIISNAFEYQTTKDETKPWYYPYVKQLEKLNGIPIAIESFSHNLNRGEAVEILWRIKYKTTSYEVEKNTFERIEEMVNYKPKKPENLDQKTFEEILAEFEKDLKTNKNNFDSPFKTYKGILYLVIYNKKQLHIYPEIDTTTYSFYNEGIIKDKNNIYFIKDDYSLQTFGDEIDAPTFTKVCAEIFKDKNNIYLLYKSKFSKIDEKVDTETFSCVSKSTYENIKIKIFKDKSNIYTLEDDKFKKINENIDTTSFSLLDKTTYYPDYGKIKLFKDNKNLYRLTRFSFSKIGENIDTESLEIVKSFYPYFPPFFNQEKEEVIVLKDKNNVYVVLESAFNKSNENIDTNTFSEKTIYCDEICISEPVYFYDKNRLYYLNKNLTLQQIEDADDETFEQMDKYKDPYLFKDKNHVYYNFQKIVDADPQSFRLNETSIYGYEDLDFYQDDNNIFVWDKEWSNLTKIDNFPLSEKKQISFTFNDYDKEIKLYYNIFTDDKNIYSLNTETQQLLPVENTDPSSFIIVTPSLFKDSHNFFFFNPKNYTLQKVKDIDFNTFEYIDKTGLYKEDFTNYFKDKNSYYYLNYTTEDIIKVTSPEQIQTAKELDEKIYSPDYLPIEYNSENYTINKKGIINKTE